LSNPILEAFGNSKTLRNNNSSRFGKWMEILFSNTNIICGARIVNYLLEKTRVVRQVAGERSYHVFYQLCAGIPDNLRTKFKIMVPSQYNFLKDSQCFAINGVDDFDEFAVTAKALSRLNFSDDEIENIWRVLSGVLLTGNLTFDVQGDGSKVANKDVLQQVAEILEIETASLEQALCFKAVEIRKEIQLIANKKEQATEARDSMAKHIYGTMFDWLVYRINSFLCKVQSKDMVGVLDIFGFEVFDINSFEQFCINYANEKLQQHFNQFIFKMEQNEYKAEGIEFNNVAFVDNQECLDLIEGNPGVLRMLDEEVMLPKGTDDGLVEKLHKTFSEDLKHKHYDRKKTQKVVFVVKHYAGEVTYTITNFCEKNRDNIYDSLLNTLVTSKNIVLKKIFEESADDALPDVASPASPSTISKASATPTMKSKGGGAKAKTLGSKFKTQLQSLMSSLNKTSPHFIRCIKPNMAKVGDNFDAVLVLKQLRYAGLFEAIRVRAAGYGYRKHHEQFWNRYRAVLPRDQRKAVAESKDYSSGCKKIIDELKELDSKDLQLGKNKVFYRTPILVYLEQRRGKAMEKFAIMLQSAARGIIAKRVKRRLFAIVQNIRAAIASDDIQQMQHALEQAEKSGVTLFEVNSLKQAFGFAKEEQQVVALLKEAIGLRDVYPIEGALAQAEKLNIEARTKKESVKKLIQEAQSLKDYLLRREEAIHNLKDAIKSETIEEMEHCLKAGAELDLPESLLNEAKELLDKLLKEKAIVDAIEAAINAKDINQVEERIQNAKGINLSNEQRKVIAKARDFIVSHYRVRLMDKVNSKSEEGVTEEIATITQKRLQNELKDEVQFAKDFLQAEAERKRREEEERRRKEEEERRRKEEEERLRREEEERKRREEEERKRKEEEERRKREEEERRKKEEEERERARKEKEEAERKAREAAEAAAKAAEDAKKKLEEAARLEAVAEAEKKRILEEAAKAKKAAEEAEAARLAAEKQAQEQAAAEDARRKAVLEEEERRKKEEELERQRRDAEEAQRRKKADEEEAERRRKFEEDERARKAAEDAAAAEEDVPPPPPPDVSQIGVIAEDEEGAPPPPPPTDEGAFDDFFASPETGGKVGEKKKHKQQLKDAIKQGDLNALENLLQTAEGTMKASKTMKLGRALADKIKKGKLVMIELKKAVDDLDRAKMKQLLEEARELDLEVEETILAARKYCYGMLDSDFRSLQFKKAMEKKDVEGLKSLIAMCQEARTSIV
jgi:myosin-5